MLVAGLMATAQPAKVVADKVLAVVGDRIIPLSDVRNAMADAARQGQELPENAECMIMEQAFVSKIMMLQAEKDSLPVTEEEIEANLDNRIRSAINQFGSQEELERIAGKTVFQIKDDARESIREQKLAEAMQQKITGNVRITPAEVKQFYERIPKDSLPFFETELEIGQIIAFPKATRELELYVIGELNKYKQKVLAGDAAFEDLAKTYSEDPGSKERGGTYQLNRNERTWDPAFLQGAFRLKTGEISPVIKSKFGYHIIKMVERNGDEAVVAHILRKPPTTEEDMTKAKAKLDSVRSKIIAGTTTFGEAATKYSEDENAKFSGPYILNRDGSTFIPIDQLDKELVVMLDKLKVGEYSQPTAYTDEQGGKAVRIVYLKTKVEPHRMNLRDDYNRISQAALEEKKAKTLDKWITNKIKEYYISLDKDIMYCEGLKKFNISQTF